MRREAPKAGVEALPYSIYVLRGARALSRAVRARYEGGVLRPLEPLELREGEEVVVVVRESLVELARRIRGQAAPGEAEPGELLSRERGRFAGEGEARG